MLWWKENEYSVKPRSITIVLDSVFLLVPNDGGLMVSQSLLWLMVVSSLGIPFLLAVLVCTYLTLDHFLLVILMVELDIGIRPVTLTTITQVAVVYF